MIILEFHQRIIYGLGHSLQYSVISQKSMSQVLNIRVFDRGISDLNIILYLLSFCIFTKFFSHSLRLCNITLLGILTLRLHRITLASNKTLLCMLCIIAQIVRPLGEKIIHLPLVLLNAVLFYLLCFNTKLSRTILGIVCYSFNFNPGFPREFPLVLSLFC